MRCLVCPELGPLDTLVLEDRPDLEAGPEQVVVEVRAAGVNYVDGLIAQGRYQMKPPTPYVPGGEIAGVVTAVGDAVTGFAPGDRVLAMTGFGAFAGQVALSPLSLHRLPESLTFAQGAAFIQSYSTALFALTRRSSLTPGEWVLVLGAGGGIGLATIDVAVALGAKVIAAASSPERLAAATAMGAEATIAYESEDLKARAREISGGGVDMVVDPVGGPHAEPALRATRAFGRYCVIGFAAGPIPTVPLNQVLLNNRTVVGVDWGAWAFRDFPANQALLAELLDMVEAGRLHPATPAERPLEHGAAVMAGLLDRTIAGKVVLVP